MHGEFVVEGAKSVLELLRSDFTVKGLWGTEDFIRQHRELLSKRKIEAGIVSEEELAGAGSFTSNNGALAVAAIKANKPLWAEGNEYVIVLDEVKDPGNLGTIVRIADWFGITKVICSEDSAEFYNPKVISASMGSFTRVSVYYTDLQAYMRQIKDTMVYGALLEGSNIHSVSFPTRGYLIMGNESSGIRKELQPFITQKLTIPGRGGAESLNVGVATAIFCDNIFRAAI